MRVQPYLTCDLLGIHPVTVIQILASFDYLVRLFIARPNGLKSPDIATRQSHLGASEATIFSKRGSPRSESQ